MAPILGQQHTIINTDTPSFQLLLSFSKECLVIRVPSFYNRGMNKSFFAGFVIVIILWSVGIFHMFLTGLRQGEIRSVEGEETLADARRKFEASRQDLRYRKKKTIEENQATIDRFRDSSAAHSLESYKREVERMKEQNRRQIESLKNY